MAGFPSSFPTFSLLSLRFRSEWIRRFSSNELPYRFGVVLEPDERDADADGGGGEEIEYGLFRDGDVSDG